MHNAVYLSIDQLSGFFLIFCEVDEGSEQNRKKKQKKKKDQHE